MDRIEEEPKSGSRIGHKIRFAGYVSVSRFLPPSLSATDVVDTDCLNSYRTNSYKSMKLPFGRLISLPPFVKSVFTLLLVLGFLSSNAEALLIQSLAL
jgi:hypothetical protein